MEDERERLCLLVIEAERHLRGIDGAEDLTDEEFHDLALAQCALRQLKKSLSTRAVQMKLDFGRAA